MLVFTNWIIFVEVRQKYSAASRIFNSLLGISSGDETLHLMFDILRLEGRSGLKKNCLLVSLGELNSKMAAFRVFEGPSTVF